MSFHEALRGAPLFVQRRYSSLGRYVRSVLETEFPSLDVSRTRREDIETIQVAAFIYALENFLEDGTRAAEKAVDVFEGIGIMEFSIGGARFAKGSASVTMGRKLAIELLSRIEEPGLVSLIRDSPSMHAIIKTLAEELGIA